MKRAGRHRAALHFMSLHVLLFESLSCLGGPKGPPPIEVGSQSDHSRFSNFRHF